jgi:hypothetical protein
MPACSRITRRRAPRVRAPHTHARPSRVRAPHACARLTHARPSGNVDGVMVHPVDRKTYARYRVWVSKQKTLKPLAIGTLLSLGPMERCEKH